MKHTPFSEINAFVEKKLGDGTICTGQMFSYLKIFQHALSYSLNQDTSKLIRNYFRFPPSLHILILKAKALSRKNFAPVKTQRLVILENGRTFDDGEKMSSFYFQEVIEFAGRKNTTILFDGTQDNVDYDVDIKRIRECSFPPDDIEIRLLRDLHEVIRKSACDGRFDDSEMRYIASAAHIFFEQFRAYYHVLKSGSAKRCVFITHYHKEGIIAALNVLGIKSIELQHGLIARNDIYYHYPKQFLPVIRRALFPDRIMLFGQYWHDLLAQGSEWLPEQLVVAGNLQSGSNSWKVHRGSKENIVMVATQKNVPGLYISYVTRLAEIIGRHTEWRLVVKLHPLEKEVFRYDELKARGIEVIGPGESIQSWLGKVKIQISIYSTTFFDALGLDVVNFSLQGTTGSDYARELVESGIAFPIDPEEDPIVRYAQLVEKPGFSIPRETVYSPLNTINLSRELLE